MDPCGGEAVGDATVACPVKLGGRDDTLAIPHHLKEKKLPLKLRLNSKYVQELWKESLTLVLLPIVAFESSVTEAYTTGHWCLPDLPHVEVDMGPADLEAVQG